MCGAIAIDLDTIRIAIPAYNAGREIQNLLRDISKYIPLSQVIVVDDGSQDQTAQIAKSLGAVVVKHAENRGKGEALRSGLRASFNQPHVQACITIDADGQHDPRFIPAFLDSYTAYSGDLIIGARKLNPRVMPMMRVLSNRITSLLINAKIGQPVLDSQCGYRLISRKLFSAIDLRSKGFEIESEMVIKAGRLGVKILWVPISTIYENEKSYIKGVHDTFRFIKVWFKY